MRKLIALSTLFFVVGCPKSSAPTNDAPSYDPTTSIVVKVRGDIAKTAIRVNCGGESLDYNFDGRKAVATNTHGTCRVFFIPGGTENVHDLETGHSYSCGDSSGEIRCQQAD